MSTIPYVKFFRGTPEAFQALSNKDTDTLYFIAATDSNKGTLYLGEKLITDNISAIKDLEDILLTELADGQLLTYDGEQAKWVNKSIIDAIGLFGKATETEMGTNGLVPAPGMGMQEAFLRGDGNWVKIETGGSNLTADDKSVSILNEVITLKDYGIKYYAFVDATGTEEEGNYVPAHYEAQVVDELHPWQEGLEPKVVKENGELILGWFEPNSATVEGITNQVLTLQDQVNDLNEIVKNKIDSNKVYTKEETVEQINAAIANADHMVRKVFDTLDDAESFALIEGEDAVNYIYMVLDAESTDESNKYNEYLYVDGKLELVGNWKVDLADYATKDDLELKVDKVEGKSLVADTEIAKLATVKENAEPNYIASVDETELKVDNGLLSVISIAPSKVTGLEELLNNKADASKVETLTTNLDIVSTKVTNIEAQLNNFVSVETYNKDIAEIKDAITWKTL